MEIKMDQVSVPSRGLLIYNFYKACTDENECIVSVPSRGLLIYNSVFFTF